MLTLGSRPFVKERDKVGKVGKALTTSMFDFANAAMRFEKMATPNLIFATTGRADNDYNVVVGGILIERT